MHKSNIMIYIIKNHHFKCWKNCSNRTFLVFIKFVTTVKQLYISLLFLYHYCRILLLNSGGLSFKPEDRNRYI